MTNQNENNKSLVTINDDDPTAEIDISRMRRTMGSDVNPEIEVDALTFEIEVRQTAINGRSRTELEAALNDQARLVEELNFEIEQLQCRRRGLQAEIQARVEIANNAIDDVETERKRASGAIRELELRYGECQKLQRALSKAGNSNERLQDKSIGLQIANKDFKKEIRSLKSAAEQRDKKVSSLEKELRIKQRKLSQRPTKRSGSDGNRSSVDIALKESRSQLADLRGYIDGRKADWEQLNAKHAKATRLLKSNDTDIARLLLDLDERSSQLIRSREQYIRVSDLLAKQNTKVRKLGKTTRELEKELHQDARLEIDGNRAQIAKQSGDIAAKTHELKTMQRDNIRIEEYSDALRIQLQDQTSISKVSVAMRGKLESSQHSANELISKLSSQLDSERERNDELSHANESMKNDYEHELRQVRFELGSAEDTMAGQEESNGQLVADLIDSKNVCTSLESRMDEVEKESTKKMRQVARQLKKAKQETNEYERKLGIREKTVTVLLQELAKIGNTNSNEAPKTVPPSADVLPITEKPSPQKADCFRVARLLIGNLDGRELRFPLFKDRVTIGRTSHNDIHLNMQYISRRHAVISSDHGKTRVIDWGSKNGVFVNDKKVTERILKPGDILTIGTTDFRYEEREKG